MAKKRLTFEVEEELHSALKQEAAKHGVPLGALCSALLDRGVKTSSLGSSELGLEMISSLPLNTLREKVNLLIETRPTNWERSVRQLNTEIARRFKI